MSTTKKRPAAKPAAKATSKPAAKKPATPERRRAAAPKKPAPKPAPRRRKLVEEMPPVPSDVPIAPAAPAEPMEAEVPAAGGNLAPEAIAHLQGLASEAASDLPPESGTDNPNAEQGPSPEEMAQQQAQQEAARMGAIMSANVAVAMGERVVHHYAPYVQIDGEQKQSLAAALADVLAKYAGNGQLPPWVIKYILPFIEELKLLAKVGVIGYSIYAQVQAEKERQAKAEAERRRQQQGNGVDLSTAGAAA